LSLKQAKTHLDPTALSGNPSQGLARHRDLAPWLRICLLLSKERILVSILRS
jgi:hypothetical protein